jgi:hypothetical protein
MLDLEMLCWSIYVHTSPRPQLILLVPFSRKKMPHLNNMYIGGEIKYNACFWRELFLRGELASVSGVNVLPKSPWIDSGRSRRRLSAFLVLPLGLVERRETRSGASVSTMHASESISEKGRSAQKPIRQSKEAMPSGLSMPT